MPERSMDVHEIARLTGWSPLTVYKKAAKGEIPGRFKLGKRSLRFKESEVIAWWQQQAASCLTRTVARVVYP